MFQKKICFILKMCLAFVLSLGLTACGGSGGSDSGVPGGSPSAGGKSGTGGSRVHGTITDESNEPTGGIVRDLVTGNEAQTDTGIYELQGVQSMDGNFLLEVIIGNVADTFNLPDQGDEDLDITANFMRRGDSIDAEFSVEFISGGELDGNKGGDVKGNSEDFGELLGTNDDDAAENAESRAPGNSEKEAKEEVDLGEFTGDTDSSGSGGQESDFNF